LWLSGHALRSNNGVWGAFERPAGGGGVGSVVVTTLLTHPPSPAVKGVGSAPGSVESAYPSVVGQRTLNKYIHPARLSIWCPREEGPEKPMQRTLSLYHGTGLSTKSGHNVRLPHP